MNRIQIKPPSITSQQNTKPANKVESRRESDLSPALFVPLHYEKNHSYPLIVWLHSNGGDPTEMLRAIPSVSLRNFIAVAPRGPVGNSITGYWWEQSSQGIDSALARVSEAIDYARMKLNVASHRIFVAGYGGGGTMAVRVGLRLSRVVAGAASINGPLPDGQTPLRGWKDCRLVPIFWAHCRHSTQFDEGQLCQQLKLLHVAGFNVTLRQYPFADELPARALKDLNQWVMEFIETAVF